MTQFSRYIGIGYSGAETPNASLKGLRAFLAQGDAPAEEVPPPPSRRKYWRRRGVADWLAERLVEDVATLVGIDHGFSFPLRYLEFHHLPPDWDEFLDDFQRHWPTDADHIYVSFIRDSLRGDGAARGGDRRWRRLCKEHCRAKSAFRFDVQAQVATSRTPVFPRYERDAAATPRSLEVLSCADAVTERSGATAGGHRDEGCLIAPPGPRVRASPVTSKHHGGIFGGISENRTDRIGAQFNNS